VGEAIRSGLTSTGRVIMSTTESRHLERSIGSRQLTMIAIGGAIGTGLFLPAARRFPRRDPAVQCSPTRSWPWRCIA